jgi:hypothetical protein
MSKKHFIALAAALKTQRPSDSAPSEVKQLWECCVKVVADVAGEFNGRFHWHTFIDACGGLF